MNTIIEIPGMHPVDQDTLNNQQITILEEKGQSKKILLGNTIYDVLVKSFDYEQKTAVINVDGYDFKVSMQEPLDQLIAQLGFLKANKHSVKDIKSPMPGLVVSVFVTVGQHVEEGDKLLSLEAMKMENILKCPGTGVVKNILVKEGDSVEKNALLIELE
ncbi:MAG: acetyl-CoA carboxylase biotin carboxyl carrier protein subunit [Chitinophagales bacterium]|nr:acetyl-CoA carboxylase biotin carboxyl carrier protein subunit [Chitinophagales bacterium]